MNNSELKQKIEETIIQIAKEHADDSTHIVNHRRCLISDIHELIDESLADQNQELREKMGGMRRTEDIKTIMGLPHRDGVINEGYNEALEDVLSLLNGNQEEQFIPHFTTPETTQTVQYKITTGSVEPEEEIPHTSEPFDKEEFKKSAREVKKSFEQTLETVKKIEKMQEEEK